jgi:cell division inhibitor SepF
MVYLGLAEEDEGYLADDYDDHEEPVREVRDRGVRRIDAREEPVPARRQFADPRAAAASPPAVARRPVEPPEEPAYRITTLQPLSFNEARQIGEEFRDGTPVIMNLTDMDDVDAKRLVDFAAGLIFGLRGRMEKVTNKVFLLSPNNVEVTETDKRRIREAGFYNQS